MSEEKINYRKTLNLPKTDFSMKAGLAQKEPKYIESWRTMDLHGEIRAQSKEAKKGRFLLHDGPPYANGNIHIGHALNKILKDMVVKYKTMQGFDSLYVPGWDCHGLPIEHQLLKERKQRKADVDSVSFREDAHKYAMKYVDIQKEQFQRLGVFGQWDKPYLTLDTKYEYWILKSLAKMNESGYVYRGLKPVNWCFSCETALAEAEVEYDNHVSKSVFVKFPVGNAQEIKGLPDKPLNLLIWTTTPWTLIANVAVAVHAAFNYSVMDCGADLIIVEETLAVRVLERAGVEGKVIKTLSGEELTALTYQYPFQDKNDGRVVTADYVTKEDGTGLVHTAPGHGQDDFQTGQKYGLEVLMPVGDNGVYKSGPFTGEHIFKANDKIIEDLKNRGLLLLQADLNHSYPHCWRCKKPIINRATQQWFMKIDHNGLRERLQEVIKNDVQWIPEAGRERILGMVVGRPDWCLSRQRYWGVPIPALKRKSDGEQILDSKFIDHLAEIVKTEGSNAWFKKDIKDLLPEGYKCPETGETEFEKTSDILDVWFDSGVSHQAVVKDMIGEDLPAELYLEGSDQHRGWFQSALIPAVAMENQAPYRQVLTHGFVVDGQGRKMSKSLGNVVSPHDIIKNNGADVLRLWVASSSYNEDIRLSKEALDRIVDAYRKIRNTIRYLISNLYDFNPDTEVVDFEALESLDQWALTRLAHTMKDVEKNYNAYEFAKVYKGVYTFSNEDMSNFYLDILKDRLYISAAQSPKRKSAQTVLYHILNHLVRALAPILTFTAEEIFHSMPKDATIKDVKSVHLLPWLDVPEAWHNSSVADQFQTMVALRPHVLKALEDKRKEGEIGSSLDAKVIFETASERDFKYLKLFESSLAGTFIVSQVEVQKVNDVDKGLSDEFAKTRILINTADGDKCDRCWKYVSDRGQDPKWSQLCGECTGIVKETWDGQ